MKNPLITLGMIFSILTIGACIDYRQTKSEGSRSVAMISFPIAFSSAMAAAVTDRARPGRDS